jgi:hypothetical protein
MVACSPSLTGGLHANKKIEIPIAHSPDISSPNVGWSIEVKRTVFDTWNSQNLAKNSQVMLIWLLPT